MFRCIATVAIVWIAKGYVRKWENEWKNTRVILGRRVIDRTNDEYMLEWEKERGSKNECSEVRTIKKSVICVDKKEWMYLREEFNILFITSCYVISARISAQR